MRSEFSNCFDTGVLRMHSRAEVAEGRRALHR